MVKTKLIRSILSLLIVGAIVLSILPLASAAMPFTDVPTSSPYYEAIEYCYDHGIMNGLSATTFAPETTLNRAMLVTILYRMSGSTMKRAPTGFTDVPSGTYYYYAVGWAQYYNIVNGITSTTFSPLGTLTREMTITLLYRYATSYKGYSYSMLSSSYAAELNDYSQISNYARTAVNWALNCGIVNSSIMYFNPKAGTARQLCAQYIFRYLTRVQGGAKAFSMRDATIGLSPQISSLMTSMGYSSCVGYDLTKREMLFAMKNSRILFSNSHGISNGIKLMDGYLYSSDIPANVPSKLDLVYISACYSGQQFVPNLYNKGAKAAVGFKGNISCTATGDGVAHFNYLVFLYLSRGDNLQTAIDKAKAFIKEGYGRDAYEEFGIDSIVTYGSFN